MNVKMTKLSNNENALRTNEVIGFAPDIPRIGQSFHVFSEPLDPKYQGRVVTTSRIEDIVNFSDNIQEIYTLNSIYRIEVLDG